MKPLGIMLLGASLLVSGEARALQSLSEFRTGARRHAFDLRESAETAAQRDEEATQATTKLLPTLTLTGGYTHNQYESVARIPNGDGTIKTATITPHDQLDATVSVAVPIVDVSILRRAAASRTVADAQHARAAATAIDVDVTVARTYYQVAAGEAVLAAAHRTVVAAEENERVVRQRLDAGLAYELDLRRATAEIEQRRQAVAEAEYELAIARRSLATASGLVPTEGGVALDDDLHDEAPLAAWESLAMDLPHVRAARLDVRAADQSTGAAAAALLPTLAGSASERLTNAAGFGQSPSYAVGVTLTWRADVSTIAGIRAQDAAASATRVREEKQLAAARDQIHDAWQRVRTQIAKSRAARASLASSEVAARLASERYRAGTATLLDVIVAQRDAFSAEVARIQSDGDLAYARAQLRLVSGRQP